ncbi:MAG: peptidoglycan-binding protein [Bacillota bacterium]|nr:peptidoglycan-binding protein [Bacillota bacterium]
MLKGGKPGRRPLACGDRGAEVVWLQNRLRQLGYAVGDADGIFGLTTEAALRRLQKDLRLRVDGVAGPQVWQLLRDPELAPLYLLHAVQAGEELSSVAGRYGVNVRALLQANRSLRWCGLFPGQILRLPLRAVWLQPEEAGQLERYLPVLAARSYQITGLILPWPWEEARAARQARTLCREFARWAKGHGLPILPLVEVRGQAAPWPELGRAADQLGARGVVLQCTAEESGLDLIREAARHCRRERRRLYLSLRFPSEQGRVLAAPEWEELGRLASRLIIHSPAIPLRLTSLGLRPWQVFLGLSARGFSPGWSDQIRLVRRQLLGGLVLVGLGPGMDRLWRLISSEFAIINGTGWHSIQLDGPHQGKAVGKRGKEL